MVQPTHGVLTNVLASHCAAFPNYEAYQDELCSIFSTADLVFVPEGIPLPKDLKAETAVRQKEFETLIPFMDEISAQQANLAIHAAKVWTEIEASRIQSLPHLAMRLETFEGISNALIINDTYTMDQEAFKSWAKFINNLPNHGYESDCKEILKYLNTKTLHAK